MSLMRNFQYDSVYGNYFITIKVVGSVDMFVCASNVCVCVCTSVNIYIYMKSSFPKRYKSILIVFMKMTFFYLDPYILLIFNLSC